MSTRDKRLSVLTKALSDQIRQSGGKLHKNPIFQKIFGEFTNKKEISGKSLEPAVGSFIEKIENDEVVDNKYEGLNNIFKLLPELDDNSSNALINIVSPIYEQKIEGEDFNVKAFVKSYYDDNENILPENNLSEKLLSHLSDHEFVKYNEIFKNSDELEEEGKDIEMINRLKEIYRKNKRKDFNFIEDLAEKNVELAEENADLNEKILKKDAMIKAGESYLHNFGQKQDETNRKIDELKKTIYDDQSNGLSVYSHLMNNRRLNRIHSFLNRGYGDMSRDEVIRKITKDLEFDDNFKYLDEKDRIKQAETLADAIFIRKEELSQKYRPTYEKLKTLNDLNMIKNLPEEAAKDLNQYDLEKYYANQKRIDKIYILPREWKRVSTAATQYNINPMLLRGIIKD